MGINMYVYTVYGIYSKWDKKFHEAHSDVEEALYSEFGYNNPHPTDRQIDSVMDYMGGSYMILGRILYSSGDFRYCENMNDYQEIDVSPENLNKIKTEYTEKFKRLYPDYIHLIDDKPWKMISMINYS